jgi:hypothetical protein
MDRDDYARKLVRQVSVYPNLFGHRVIFERLDKFGALVRRHDAFIFAVLVCLAQKLDKMAKLPENACQMRTEHDRVLL